jgi:hypothetical protein
MIDICRVANDDLRIWNHGLLLSTAWGGCGSKSTLVSWNHVLWLILIRIKLILGVP